MNPANVTMATDVENVGQNVSSSEIMVERKFKGV